jgi:SAM-dependent methyltransferase
MVYLSINRGKKIIDIGANLGYFCHRFEDIGYDCCGVGIGKEELYFMQKLNRAENKQFFIIEDSILDYQTSQDIQFDIVLALNIIHHFLRNKTNFNNLIFFLRRLKCKELFFEPHIPEEEQKVNSFKNFPPDEFAEFIKENTNLKRVDKIYQCPDERYIYKIY